MSLVATQKIWPISHTSDVSAARRYGAQLSHALGFDETTAGKLSLIITETATNILKHAHDGQLLLTHRRLGEINGIEILALDKGPGMHNLAHSLRDGVTTTGTAGNGLGALRRLSDNFDAYSVPDKGAAFYMCIWSDTLKCSKSVFELGTICAPMQHEEVCGDGWAISIQEDSATFLLTDGLGHGINAAHAAEAAKQVLIKRPGLQPLALMELMHSALHGTRGAAVAVAQFQFNVEQLNFVGIGNISACVIDAFSRKQLVSHNGIVGHNMRKVQLFTVPFPVGALYIMHSDGINTQWDLSAYPGLYLCHPALIAGVIYRDFLRGRDDASVLVARYHSKH